MSKIAGATAAPTWEANQARAELAQRASVWSEWAKGLVIFAVGVFAGATLTLAMRHGR